MLKRLYALFLFFFLQTAVIAQSQYPLDYFRSPVDTAITLAGNFGEIRPNHFHAGFDIKTNGREGLPVYAAADGYISRIKISPFGYGKALYIRHGNGYTSVYGHLSGFAPPIDALTKKIQSFYQAFEMDTLLTETALPVKKGQLIGYSGNTGGSQGPHLHFEIRESTTEKPVNPYYFGYSVPDHAKPKITGIAVYPLGATATVNGRHLLKRMKPKLLKGEYHFAPADTVSVSGEIGFGIETYDTEDGSTNQNGVFSVELQAGGRRIFYYEQEKFSFENARYVNAHIDYAEKQKHNVKIQKCFLSKNNQLEIYKNMLNNGIINFTDDSVHWIRFIVKDFVGNTTELMLKVKSKRRTELVTVELTGEQAPAPFDCTTEYKKELQDVKISIPPYALYDDVKKLDYRVKPALKGAFSQTYAIMNTEIPLQKAFSLSIRPNDLPDSMQSKACIISIDEKGRRSYEGGKYASGYVTTQTKTFGNFAVAIDTTAPKLKPAFKFVPNKATDLSKAKTIGITATDNLSGIRKYRATIDGNWVLCEYEFKQNLLFYTFDDSVTRGEHFFMIEVTDDKNNKSSLIFRFNR